VRAPRPLNPSPFVTLITPTFRRPVQLAACLESVGRQTAADQVQHLVLPDHVGHGIVDGLYGRMPWCVGAVRGRYVAVLCDDDVLAGEAVVAQVQAFADERKSPPVIVARVVKNGMSLPACPPDGPPQCGAVDMASYIVRADIWAAHAGDYGRRYEGDYDHAAALWAAGHPVAFCDALWAVGGASHGRPEVDY
jgi:glycosyltransferase involved in cell wall biosynthesis